MKSHLFHIRLKLVLLYFGIYAAFARAHPPTFFQMEVSCEAFAKIHLFHIHDGLMFETNNTNDDDDDDIYFLSIKLANA